jgi:hypothetical protein
MLMNDSVVYYALEKKLYKVNTVSSVTAFVYPGYDTVFAVEKFV